MVRPFALSIALLVASLSPAADAEDFIEAFHTVASVGSTIAAGEFSIDGPPPVLYVDLAATLPDMSYLESRWYANTEGAPRFTTYASQVPTDPDKYWFEVPFTAWQDWKYPGPWRVDTTLYSLELILIYGVGVGSFASYAVGSSGFDVVNAAPIPEPSAALLFAAGALALVGWQRGRRRAG
jgi:hypothetical protein